MERRVEMHDPEASAFLEGEVGVFVDDGATPHSNSLPQGERGLNSRLAGVDPLRLAAQQALFWGVSPVEIWREWSWRELLAFASEAAALGSSAKRGLKSDLRDRYGR